MLRACVLLTIVFAGALLLGERAAAYVEFQKAFVSKYLPEGTDKQYADLVRKKARCNVCHQGRSKKHENSYGRHFGQLVGKRDKKNREKILAALEQVAERHSVEGDRTSPTYGERIAAGELPVDLDEAKKEPAE